MGILRYRRRFPKDEAKQRFWEVAVDCLVDLFGYSTGKAREQAGGLRARVEARRGADLFYHAEPLDVALDLAGGHADLEALRQRYDAILQRREFTPTLPATSTRRHYRRTELE